MSDYTMMTPTPTLYSTEEWKSLIERLPSRDILEESHIRFKERSFAGVSLAGIERAFHEHYLLFPIGHVSLTGMAKNQRVLYRARWIDVSKEQVSNPSAHSYPSALHTPPGRANIQGQPVFYASPSPLTALFEIGLDGYKHGKSLFIGRWRHTTDEPWIRHPILPGVALQGFVQKYDEEMREAARSSLTMDGAGRIDDLLFLNDCFSDLFLSANYEASSWIAHTLLYLFQFGDEVQYPSIQRSKGSLCSAIKSSVIDQGRLILETVLFMDISHVEYSAPSFELTASRFMLGTPSHGRIVWAEANQEQLNDFFPELASGILSISEKVVGKSTTPVGTVSSRITRISPTLEVESACEQLNGVFRQTHHFEIGITPYGGTGEMRDRGVKLALVVCLQAGDKVLYFLRNTCLYVIRLSPNPRKEDYRPFIADAVAGYNESVTEKAEKEGWFAEAILMDEDSFNPAVALELFAESWQRNQ